MSRQPARSWLTAAARYSRRPPRSPAGLTAVRYYLKPTGQEAPPESPADWQRLQLDRADFKTLGMSSTYSLPRDTPTQYYVYYS